MSDDKKFAFLGAGAMGGTIVAGLVRSGRDPHTIGVTTRSPQRRQQIAAEFGVVAFENNSEAVAWADVVVIGVKPADVLGLLDEISGVMKKDTVVISLAAGLGTDLLAAHLPAGSRVVRVMPNTPAKVGAGISGISGGSAAAAADVAEAIELMSAVGQAVVIPEKQQDVLTAISGSGPAYVFYFVEALIEAGVTQGLPRQLATQLAKQTLFGSALLLSDGDESPAQLREAVTSPGGTTAAALRVFDDHAMRAAIQDGVEACAVRSAELAEAAKKS